MSNAPVLIASGFLCLETHCDPRLFATHSSSQLHTLQIHIKLVHAMFFAVTENDTLDYVLRALQLLFAIIVMGTDGYGM